MNVRNVRCDFIILLILAGRLPELFKCRIGTDDKLICHGSEVHVIFSYQPKGRSGKGGERELETFEKQNSHSIIEFPFSDLRSPKQII